MNQERKQFYYLAIAMMAGLSLALAGCATANKSVGLGGVLGAGTGAALGGIADPGKNGEYRTRNVILGSALGGMAGMIAGSAIHEVTEQKKQEAFLKGQLAGKSVSREDATPSLKNARVEAHWVEGKAAGNRYVAGHMEYVIAEPARWEGE